MLEALEIAEYDAYKVTVKRRRRRSELRTESPSKFQRDLHAFSPLPSSFIAKTENNLL